MPCVYGDSMVHVDRLDYIIHHDEELLEYDPGLPDEVAQKIGGYIARIVQDGDTIQVGYGAMPNAIVASLKNKKHLGVHTELISDGIVELMKAGVVDNSQKKFGRGKTVASFCMGTNDTYDYIHDNPEIEFRTIDVTNNPLTIASFDNMVAINSALQIDLTGQATADSLGKVFYSGVGGQLDFIYGAARSEGGVPIIALPVLLWAGELRRSWPLDYRG
jgi:acyl-CoA hydrolase